MMKSFDELRAEKVQEVVLRADEFDFCEMLTLLRSALKLSRKNLAEDVGIPDWQLYNWEHGRIIRPPKYEHLVTLADYFGVSPRLLKKKATEFSMDKKKCT